MSASRTKWMVSTVNNLSLTDSASSSSESDKLSKIRPSSDRSIFFNISARTDCPSTSSVITFPCILIRSIKTSSIDIIISGETFSILAILVIRAVWISGVILSRTLEDFTGSRKDKITVKTCTGSFLKIIINC